MRIKVVLIQAVGGGNSVHKQRQAGTSMYKSMSVPLAKTSDPESEVNFNITVSDKQLSILQQKLALTILPDELEDAGQDYGAPLADIRRLVSRWKEGYDWRKHEAQLNAELPQFTRNIEVEGHGTLNIHYVHKKSEVVDAIPLLFVHGCELKLLENLQNPDTITFSRAWKLH